MLVVVGGGFFLCVNSCDKYFSAGIKQFNKAVNSFYIPSNNTAEEEETHTGPLLTQALSHMAYGQQYFGFTVQ